MRHSKRLAVATMDRTISFYALDGASKKTAEPPKSRIEDLPAVPICLEYIKHNTIGVDNKKNPEDKKALESLIWGDDLGIITKYDFTETNWHICQYKHYAHHDKQYLQCHVDQIRNDFNERQWDNNTLRDVKKQF